VVLCNTDGDPEKIAAYVDILVKRGRRHRGSRGGLPHCPDPRGVRDLPDPKLVMVGRHRLRIRGTDRQRRGDPSPTAYVVGSGTAGSLPGAGPASSSTARIACSATARPDGMRGLPEAGPRPRVRTRVRRRGGYQPPVRYSAVSHRRRWSGQ